MADSQVIAELQERIDSLELRLTSLRLDNKRLQKDARIHSLNESKLQEVQRIAALSSWEASTLTGQLTCSEKLSAWLSLGTLEQKRRPNIDDLMQAVHPKDRDAVVSAYESCLETGQPRQLKHRMVAADGQIRIVEHYMKTFQGKRNVPLKTIGILLDVTERERLTVRLEEAHAKLGSTLASVRSIHDNVPYGLLMVDAQHRVLAGYSKACDDFLTEQGPTIEGRKLETLLGLDPRMSGHFGSLLDQVFMDILPEELSLDQIPDRIRVKDRWVNVSASVIRDNGGDVSAVLFTLLDITDLIDAEQNQERLHGIVKVLMHKEAFTAFIRDFDAELEAMLGDLNDQARIRRALHTAKSGFALFSLMGISRQIHRIEDAVAVDASHLEELHRRVRALLAENEDLWAIRLDQKDEELVISRSSLEAMSRIVAESESLEEARRAVAETIVRLQEKPFSALAGPLRESFDSHVQRRHKQACLEIRGGDVLVPAEYREVLGVLPHLLRNAVDHGIEPPDSRGDKCPRAHVGVEVERSGGQFRVVVSDDGCGVDGEKLKRKALEGGKLTPEEAARLSRREILELMLLDQVSTAKSITTTSGEGSACRRSVPRSMPRGDTC